jgi:hypothetical protein
LLLYLFIADPNIPHQRHLYSGSNHHERPAVFFIPFLSSIIMCKPDASADKFSQAHAALIGGLSPQTFVIKYVDEDEARDATCDGRAADGSSYFSSLTLVLKQKSADGTFRLDDLAIRATWVPSRWAHDDLPEDWMALVKEAFDNEQLSDRRTRLAEIGQTFVSSATPWEAECRLPAVDPVSRHELYYIVEWAESHVQFYELDRGVRFDILATLLAHGMRPF